MIVIGGILLCTLWFLLSQLAEWLVFSPPHPYEETAKMKFVGKVPYFEYRSSNPNAITIIYSHGNGGNIMIADDHIHELSRDLHANIILYDYTGYGPRTRFGKCSEKACYHDIRAIYDHLISRGVPPGKIVVMGTSLGAGPSFDLASKVPVAGIIIRSGYTSIVRVVSSVLGFWLAEILAHIPFVDIFDNLSKVDRISAPVYWVHGRKDPLILFDHCLRMVQCLSKRKLLWRYRAVDLGDHDNLMVIAKDVIIKDIREFLRYIS